MNENIKVLGITGSPRTAGNTALLIKEVLTGAREKGARVTKVFLSQLNIKPCLACNTCKIKGSCIYHDDMQKLLDQIRESDVCVLGTPVFFWGPTAQFKTFIDRFYGAKQVMKGKRIIIVIPFEDRKTETARHLVGMLKETFAWLQAQIIDIILAPGVLDPGEIAHYPEVIISARRAGRNAVVIEELRHV
ncbi:MAG: flavodoxin family protein [bacterium]|nr:MAG: flavodoxin family protein [bacterium]